MASFSLSLSADETTQSLAGEWRLLLGGPAPVAAPDAPPPPLVFNDTIVLPATTATANKGPLCDERRITSLTPVHRYEGPAWYERDVVVPAAWQGKRVVLFLERTKYTRVWLDGRAMGENPLLCTSHEYVLGPLAPGSHKLTVLVDNSRKPVPGENHQISDNTQGNWNGLLGRLELRATDSVWIDRVDVTPDVAARTFRLSIALGNSSNSPESGTVTVEAVSYNHPGNPHQPAKIVHPTDAIPASGVVEFDLPLGPDAKPWDEFSPALYRLTVTLESPAGRDVRVVTTGLREFAARSSQFTINGRTTFLRGKTDNCVFPLTGHPPLDVAGWRSYFRVLLDYGINHVRFHSWTPPDAAFTAADELGLYLQPELPFWGEWNDNIRRALQPEGEAILRTYGQHPSFVMLALGNEHWNGRAVMGETVAALRKLDPTRLYAEGSNNFLWAPELSPGDDYWTTVRVPSPAGAQPASYANVRACFSTNDKDNGHIQTGPANTRHDYSAAIAGIPVPVIGHEVGQYTVTPNFDEIAKYTGVFRARNLEYFRDKAAAAGLLDQAGDFFRASGKLAALCYREELEAALRTPGFGGFHVLDLQDFPGQGTALVGLLDAFLDSKGAITPAEFRMFCGPQVLLARFDRYVWTGGETFSADLDLAHYGPTDLPAGTLAWTLRDGDGRIVARGSEKHGALAQGGVRRVATVQTALPAVTAAQKLVFEATLDGTGILTSYPLWVYPGTLSAVPIAPANVTIARHFDAAVQAGLAAGGRVLLMPDAAHPFAHTPGGGFMTDFWCWPMFYNTPGTMGLLIQPDHAALAGFPTETHSNWQWFNLVRPSQPVVLDSLPVTLRPAVQVIDNLDRVHRLGLVFETKVGAGRLLVCAADLPAVAPQHPEARQLLASLLSYASSEKFNPTVATDPGALGRALEARLPLDGAKLSASSSRPNRDPFRVLNNNDASGWTAARNVVGEWWQADFAAPANFDAVELAWDKEQTGYRGVIEVTEDGATWRVLLEQDSGATPIRYQRLECHARGIRALRVRVTGLPQGADVGLGELRLIQPDN